jgi:hypothetical protein
MTEFKIVDVFNGGEFESFENRESAEDALFKKQLDFYSSNPSASCCLAIVPANADWYFCPRENRFIWG